MGNFLDNVTKLVIILMLLTFTALSAGFAVYIWLDVIIPKL